MQISGGEPTLHPELPTIIDYARQLGFKNIELVTNGILISNNPSLLQSLAAEGLTAVYLQFDGLSRTSLLKIRGQDMSEIRTRSISAIRQAKLCCTLAVAVVRNVNDHELGDIVRFGIDNIDTVRAINFQSATQFSGRFEIDKSCKSYSLEELITLLEAQLNLRKGGFLTNIVGHPDCNGVSLLYNVGNRLEPLFSYLHRSTLERFLGPDKRSTILDLFMGKDHFIRKYLLQPRSWKLLSEAVAIFGKNPCLVDILKANHILIFAKSFMNGDSLNNDRLKDCVYGMATSSGVYSFCAFNNLHRFPTDKKIKSS